MIWNKNRGVSFLTARKRPLQKHETIYVFSKGKHFYNYEEAKAVCKAYNSDLASYDQIEEAYNNKGEWCSYGWSKGQNVYYPTQKGSYDKLQKIPGHENDCGRPGINGGYIGNENAKFGVNCYGYKPAITSEEQKLEI